LDGATTAAAAARGVLNGLLGPTATADSTAAIEDLYTEQRDQRASDGVTDAVLAASGEHGQRVAAAILE
jgi:hypothetical protein